MPRRPKFKPGDLVELTWEDAWSDDDASVELGEEPEHRPYTINLTGYLVFMDKDGVSLARERMVDGTYRSVQYTPRGMILDIKRKG